MEAYAASRWNARVARGRVPWSRPRACSGSAHELGDRKSVHPPPGSENEPRLLTRVPPLEERLPVVHGHHEGHGRTALPRDAGVASGLRVLHALDHERRQGQTTHTDSSDRVEDDGACCQQAEGLCDASFGRSKHYARLPSVDLPKTTCTSVAYKLQ